MAATILSGNVDGHGPGEVVTFASLASLARRAGGTGGSWTVEHEPAFDPARRTVMLLRSDRHGTHVVARVRVDSEAITSS